MVAVKDITDKVVKRKELEKQSKIIKEQRDELEIIIKNISDGICIINKDLSYRILSDSVKEYFSDIKYLGDSLKYNSYYDYYGEMIDYKNLPAYRVLKGEKIENFIQVIKKPDKTMFINTCGYPIYDSNGEVYKAVLCYKDITDQINYESILQTQRDYFYKIIDSLEVPIIRLSYPDYVVMELNKKAKELLNEMIPTFHNFIDEIKTGYSVKDYLYDYYKDDKENNIISQLKNDKVPVEINNIKIMKKDKKIYAKLIFQPILNSSGEMYEILMVVIDVTREVEQKEEIQKLLKFQGEIFSFITHEFKTPLSIISAAVQAMEFLCKDELSDKSLGYLKKIKQSCLQQLRLVNNLLDVIRADAGYLKIYKKNIDIVKITKDIIELVSVYAKQKNININLTTQFESKIVAIDDEKYERIILNLLSNAIKYTPADKNIYVNLSSNEDNICIEVKDEGVGIPKDKQELIFQRFSQLDNSLSRQSDGSGIGLSITKSFTNALGGWIELNSDVDKGSSFKVYLPDETIEEDNKDEPLNKEDNTRLMQNVNIEFSNIYYN